MAALADAAFEQEIGHGDRDVTAISERDIGRLGAIGAVLGRAVQTAHRKGPAFTRRD